MIAQLPLFVLLSVVLLAAGVLVLVLSYRWVNREDLSHRLNEFVADQTHRTGRRLRPTAVQTRNLTGSLISRLLVPLIKTIGRFFGRLTPAGAIESLNHQLLIAGNPFNLGAREYFGIEMAFTFLGIFLAYTFLRRGFALLDLVLALTAFAVCYLLPRAWLSGRVRRRQNLIRRGLPDALDMLSVCASAGLGFDQSLQRVSEHWDNPVGWEFSRAIAEMEMGLSRRDALRSMANRVDVSELSSFVALIIQTDQLGMSISDTLHAQAEQMRIERRFRAQEQAQKIPTKMLFPMAFLIFPALLAVLLGPAAPILVDLFANF
jgi:tight adherence protein C